MSKPKFDLIEIKLSEVWHRDCQPYQGEAQCTIEIDLTEIIDPYTYHDAPATVDIIMGVERLTKLRDALSEIIKEMEAK